MSLTNKFHNQEKFAFPHSTYLEEYTQKILNVQLNQVLMLCPTGEIEEDKRNEV